MFREIKLSALTDLKGNYFKAFLKVFLSFFSKTIFILSSIVCIYFCFFDKFILIKSGLNENFYLFLCLFAATENTVLYLISVYFKLKSEVYFFDIKCNISIKDVLRAVILQFNLFSRKTALLFLFCLPALFTGMFTIALIKTNLGAFASVILMFAFCVLLISGLVSYSIYKEKFSLVWCFFLSEELQFKDIFEFSSSKMNGKCAMLFSFKLLNLPKKIASFFIIPAFFYLPYCKLSERKLITEKPYLTKKSNTAKSVVFYLGKTTA